MMNQVSDAEDDDGDDDPYNFGSEHRSDISKITQSLENN